MSHFLVFALHLCVSYVQSHHFPWLQPHELQSIHFSRLTAIRTHHPISHVSLGEAPSRLPHTFFPPTSGGCCCQGKEVVPVDHIRGKGLSPRLTSGSKIRLTAGFEPRPQGPASSSLAAAHSPFECGTCFVHSIPVLAALHSSLAKQHHILRRTLLPS